MTAIRPTLTDRYDLFQAMLPTGTTALAGSITFAAGAALLLLAGGLARRKHRAWLLAIALVAFAAVATSPAASTWKRRSGAPRSSAPCSASAAGST